MKLSVWRGWVVLVAVAVVVLVGGLSNVAAQGTSGSGTFTDSRDGKAYKTVKIGGKTWMAENLNYQTDGSGCYYNNSSNCDKYGRLYDWNTARYVCPSGWHLPSRQEWDNLCQAVGGERRGSKKMKSTSGWNSGGNGTDDYGFSALPGGWYSYYGVYFSIGGDFGGWWTATEYSDVGAYRRYMNYKDEYVGEDYYFKGTGFSVRCVQND
jgi:uncharacterized protein (TIGR02145 family)